MVQGGRRIVGICLTLTTLLAGCSGAPRGKLINRTSLPASGAIQGRALTSEVDGLRVLWNGPVFGKDHRQRGLVAGNRAQFAALWRKVQPPQGEPAVDFSQYVALAVVGMGSMCPWEVIGVELDSQNVLRVEEIGFRLKTPRAFNCPDVGVRRALVLAVPRSLLDSSAILVEEEAFRFSIPKPGQPSTQPRGLAATPTPLIVPRGERIELPDRGTVSLRTFSNGAQVWVTHQSDGTVNVVSSVVALDNPLDRYQPFGWATIGYSEDLGRFWREWDSTGQSVHGRPPIQSFAWTRADNEYIVLNGTQLTAVAPIQAPDVAPHLVGDSRAYSDVPLAEWSDIPDGHVALVDLDFVWFGHRLGELCKAPPQEAPLKYFEECPAGSPAVIGPEGELGHPTKGGSIHYGPWVVQRQGQKALLLANRWIGGTGRRVPAPPERECPLHARSGHYRGYHIEWTAKDGPDAYQKVCGGPKGVLRLLPAAVLRGDGTEQIGDALRRELEPRLSKIAPVNGAKRCIPNVLSISPGAWSGENAQCYVDQYIEVVGEYLRERNASDRVVVGMPLKAAPAIRRQ